MAPAVRALKDAVKLKTSSLQKSESSMTAALMKKGGENTDQAKRTSMWKQQTPQVSGEAKTAFGLEWREETFLVLRTTCGLLLW